ncbi:DUF4249 domain-containing protein [Rufibacter quisquiliarum]|uniref:DUF4249 domain-containing protein n=2 Tax=Rufibacter TaxID=1379908 RepID=A0A839GP67_9BACT|nr:DUF4249 domain-containing protein [Rufibacter quisquiliarum]MBA9078589.1 hypothetical protein [Rufibacter quisquiliarum]
MEQEIEVKLPTLPSQLVVECYLENGQPYRLALSESQSYFAGNQPSPVDDAKVTITKNNEPPVSLTFKLVADEKNEKVYTHQNTRVVDGKPGDVFTLLITDPRGRRLTGTTTVLAPVPFDSVGYKFNDKPVESQEAYLLVRWQDQPSVKNFYRLLAHQDSAGVVDSKMDAELNDRLRDGKKITYTTTYRFKHDDTLNIKLFHIDEAYYNFISSIEDARRANGNPFAQPVSIKSTVAGGFGVFTHLNYSAKQLIIK